MQALAYAPKGTALAATDSAKTLVVQPPRLHSRPGPGGVSVPRNRAAQAPRRSVKCLLPERSRVVCCPPTCLNGPPSAYAPSGVWQSPCHGAGPFPGSVRFEARLLPSTDYWLGLAGKPANWNNAASWSEGHVPGAGDTAAFRANSPSCNVTADVSVAGLQLDVYSSYNDTSCILSIGAQMFAASARLFTRSGSAVATGCAQIVELCGLKRRSTPWGRARYAAGWPCS